MIETRIQASVHIECGSYNPDADCECSIGFETNYNHRSFDPDVIHKFIEKHGWLMVGEDAYCPSCRKQLHD